MHRDGADPGNIDISDVLCDFCEQPWTLERYMIEGHRGACICQHCLTVAYTEVVLHGASAAIEADEICSLCRERDDQRPFWRSPLRREGVVCQRCVKQAAGVLHKADDIPWRKPTLTPTGRPSTQAP